MSWLTFLIVVFGLITVCAVVYDIHQTVRRRRNR